MRAIVQRVKEAEVRVDGQSVGRVGRGLLVYVGVQDGDGPEDAAYIAGKVCGLRIFPDDDGKMNLSARDVGGGVLTITNFTLLGDARKGRRPSFVAAAAPESAERLCEDVADAIRTNGVPVETGIFRAQMEISSVADGPVNVLLDSRRVL